MAATSKRGAAAPAAVDLHEIIAGTARRGGQPQKVLVVLGMLPVDYHAALEEVLSKPQSATWSDRRIAEIFNQLLAKLNIDESISASAIHNYRQSRRV